MKDRTECPRCGDDEGDWLYECRNQDGHPDDEPIIRFCTVCSGGHGGLLGGLRCPVCDENTHDSARIVADSNDDDDDDED